MRILLVGGMRSGKSREAERRLANASAVTYVACGGNDADDDEWTARVTAHRARRPASWTTVETLEVAALLRDATSDDPPVLWDCVNTWLARVMGDVGCWTADGVDRSVAPLVARRADDLVGAWKETAADAIAVTNEVGMALVPTTPAGRWFAEELGDLNRRLAEVADEVWQVTVGIATRLR